MHTGIHQALDQRSGQRRAAQTTIAPHGHDLLARRTRGAAKGAAQSTGHVLIQGSGDDAPNVIGFENRGGKLHGGVSCSEIKQKKEGGRL